MAQELNAELLASALGVDPDTLKTALADLQMDLAELGKHHANYVSSQHEAFLRGVESAEKVLTGRDEHASHAAAIDEAQLLAPEASKIRHFDQTQVGKAVRALIYQGN